MDDYSVASTYGGCWGAGYTMTCHAALGVVRAGVATLKGTGVRINCISPGQIDIGVDLKGFDMRGLSAQFPPSSLQSGEGRREIVGLERAGVPGEVGRVAGFLASSFSYVALLWIGLCVARLTSVTDRILRVITWLWTEGRA